MIRSRSPRPRHKGERELAKAKGYAAGHETHGDAAEHAGPGVEGPDADRQTGEKRQRKDSEGEQQPAEKPMPTMTRSGPKMIMAVYSVR